MSAEPSRCTMQRHKQRTLQRCKTNRASNKRHPIFIIDRGFSTDWAPTVMAGAFVYIKAATQVKILQNFHKTALLHLQKYRISVIMSIV